MNPLIEHYRAMARYNAWANGRLHEVCRRLSDEDFALRRTSFFPSLQLTLNHILLVDRYYVAGLDGARPDYSIFVNEVPYPTMAELFPAQRELDRRLISFCNSLEADTLEVVVVLDRGSDGIHREKVASVLPHLFLHQVHHRGQATAMLAGTRENAPQLDEFFLLADWPVRDQELAALFG